MGCEICGRSSCTKSFHSLEEQSGHDDIADSVKERLRGIIKHRIVRLKSITSNDETDTSDYINLDQVLSIIDEAD